MNLRGSIPHRFAPVLFGALLSFIMVSVVSAVVILVNQGIGNDFLARWARSVATTWPIAFPVVLVVAPAVRRIVAYFTTHRPDSA